MMHRSTVNPLAPTMALSHVLNFARAIAALLVLFFHVRSTLVVPYDSLIARNWLSSAFFMITTFGHDAVIVFFVLSGYLVGGAVLRIDMRSPRDICEYWLDRSIRIGPVLIAATALSATLQQFAPNLGCDDTPQTVLGNALGFQNFLVRPLCNNLPLWSISNEVVYYFAFPVMVAIFARVFSAWLVVACAGVALIVALSFKFAALDDTNVVLDFPFWLIGAALWFVPAGFPRQRWPAPVMLAGALVFGRLEFGKEHFWLRDLLLAVSFSYVLITFFNRAMPQSGIRSVLAEHLTDWSRRFADLSFSLYVTHYPLIRLYMHFLDATHRPTRHTAITLLVVLEFACLCAACIIVASGFSALFERPRRLFKKVLADRLLVPLPAKPDDTGR
ncbi:acyltransferase family protein [Bradyrhizobium sp. STM 3562]|uniref:acyltransferase family protein n=1 Tax=Bradyrhizobium sp. STM 3562 TaxID=578924 RepID=UPI00388D5541